MIYQLHEGDCLDVLPTLPRGEVAFIFADLPYGVTRNKWDSCVDLASLWAAIRVAAKDNATTACTATQPFATSLIVSNRKAFRYDLIWHKPVATGHLNAKRAPLRAHEHVLIFCDKSSTYRPQMVSTGIAPRRYKRGTKHTANYGAQVPTHHDDGGKRYPRSVMQFSQPGRQSGIVRSLHPTQKPVALLEWLIASYTQPGDLVADPCMGSGTTGVACARLGRRFVGIEKDEIYFATAKARIDAEHVRLAQGAA